jgi:hypothetical protein
MKVGTPKTFITMVQCDLGKWGRLIEPLGIKRD